MLQEGQLRGSHNLILAPPPVPINRQAIQQPHEFRGITEPVWEHRLNYPSLPYTLGSPFAPGMLGSEPGHGLTCMTRQVSSIAFQFVDESSMSRYGGRGELRNCGGKLARPLSCPCLTPGWLQIPLHSSTGSRRAHNLGQSLGAMVEMGLTRRCFDHSHRIATYSIRSGGNLPILFSKASFTIHGLEARGTSTVAVG
jgi:hypothetical protein